MAKFRVIAVTKEGEKYDETIEAEERFAVYRDLRGRGDRIIELTEERKHQFFSIQKLLSLFEGVPQDEKVVMARNLAAMLEAGLPTSRALSVMERQAASQALRKVLGSVIADVRRGSTLSQAFSRFPDVFPPLMVSMVRAGEESGKLADALRVVASQMEKASNLTKKIRGALMYPSIVVIAMIGIGILMLIYVVPTLSATFKELGAELPPTTKFVIALSTFLATHTLLALGIMLGFVILLVWAARTKTGERVLDWVFLNIPVIRHLVVETNAARTTRTLASLLSSGVDVVLSIAITRDVVRNSFYRKVLMEAEASVTKGGQLSQIFNSYPALYPPLVAEMVAVGEETGRLSDLLAETARFYEDAVEQQTKDLSTIVEPFLMIIIGAGVGFFAISMIAPIYSLSSSI
jgi:type IV pilus assembly protein PilC